MSEWKDCGHCDSPAEHALHLRVHELECRLFESERRLDALQKAARLMVFAAHRDQWPGREHGYFKKLEEALK